MPTVVFLVLLAGASAGQAGALTGSTHSAHHGAATPNAKAPMPTAHRLALPQQARTSSPYVWPNGPADDVGFFPIGVWLQDPDNAPAYRSIGINLFIGQWQGPTEAQLASLRAAGMPVIADQNQVALSRLDDPTLAGWLQQDEPDNAQPDGAGGYGPCVEPAVVVERYEQMRRADPTRPVLLNLGQGVAHDIDRPYVGAGAADIVSFDIYPVTSPYDHIRGDLWRVALGVDRLREWTAGTKIIWNVIETTHISSESLPTPHQIRAEVWMSLVHGSMGIVYFAHEWKPAFREAALLHYPETRDAVAAINAEILGLAPVLNSGERLDEIALMTHRPGVPVDILARGYEGWVYLFAVSMRDEATDLSFAVPQAARFGTVEVLGEDRRLELRSRVFEDHFEGYDVHLYRMGRSTDLELPWLGR